MFCFKRTYVPRFILSLLYSFISCCCVELLLGGTFVDRRICLHKFLSILNLNCFVLLKFIRNFLVCEMLELNFCDVVCCLLRSFYASELSQGPLCRRSQTGTTSKYIRICFCGSLVHPWASRCACPGRTMQMALTAVRSASGTPLSGSGSSGRATSHPCLVKLPTGWPIDSV